MMKLQIEKILHEKKITKTAFAEMLGIKKQNVNLLLETRNIDKIQEIADTLGVSFNDLVFENKVEMITPSINGYIEINSEIYPVKSREQYINLIDKIDRIDPILNYTNEELFMKNIESFYNDSIKNSQSGAIMMKYDINKILTLTYDSETKRFYLTLYRGNGITQHMIYDIAKHDRTKIADDIIKYIETSY